MNLNEVHNDANWYDFGFVVRAGILFSGGSRGARGREGPGDLRSMFVEFGYHRGTLNFAAAMSLTRRV